MSHRLLLSLLLLFSTPPLVAQNSASWVQRANQGPETPKSAQWLQYELDSTRLRIVFVVDSTDPGNYIYMVLHIPGYKGKGTYNLTTATVYQYGNRSDQRTICDAGSCTITDVDNNTNDVFGTFDWIGTANLQSGITLTQRISQGQFKLRIKPPIVMVTVPGDSAKFKRDKDVSIKVYARDEFDLNRFIPNVEITFKHDGTAFDGDKEIKKNTGMDGGATFALHVKENAVGGDYTYSVQGKSENTKDSPIKNVPFKVEESDRYYYTKCAGLPFTEFDAGEGNQWEEDGSTAIAATGSDIRLAGSLKIDGSVRIDTVGGHASVTGSGKVYFASVLFDGIIQPFFLYNGPIAFFVPPCEAEIDFLTSEIASRLTGGRLDSAKLRFLGNGVTSSGAEIKCVMKLGENAHEGCNDEMPFGTLYQPNKKAQASLTLGFLNNGTNTDLIVSGTIKNFSPVASWCVKETTVSYDGTKSELTLAAKAKTPLFDDASASVTFKSGTLNAFSADFELSKCVPLPNNPSWCWKGGGFSVENLWIGNPIKGRVNAKFGPVPPLDKTMLLTIDAGHSDPPAITDGGVTLQLFEVPQLSQDKPFQGEFSGRLTVEWGKAKATLKGDGKILHLGGDYFLTGMLSGSVGFNPLMLGGEINGALQFPAASSDVVQKMGFFGKFLSQVAPLPLGSATATANIEADGPKTVSVSYDMRTIVPPPGGDAALYNALREIGHGSLTVDLDRLPSPAAFEFDGGFTKLLGGLFSSTVGKGTSTQATDKTFTVAPGEESLVAFISSDTEDLASTLTDPSGTIHATTNVNVRIHRVLSEDRKMTMWVVGQPQAGEWKLSAPDAAAADSFFVGAASLPPIFDVAASVEGNNVVVSWSGDRIPNDATVRVFLGNSLEEVGGWHAATTSAQVGSVTIPLNDSTVGCTFSVYASMTHATARAGDHANGLLDNPTITLPAPSNVSAISDQSGNTVITWSPITDGRVAAVAVFDAIADTVIAAAYNFEIDAGVMIPNHDGRTLTLRSIDKRGAASCPTDAVNIVTSIDGDEHSLVRTGGSTIVITPHPVHDRSVVTIRDVSAGFVTVQVLNLLGQEVMPASTTMTDGGTVQTTLDTTELSSGSYVIVVRSTNDVRSVGMIVDK